MTSLQCSLLLAVALTVSLVCGSGTDLQQLLEEPKQTEINCFSRVPNGRDKLDAESSSMPPVGFTIGDVKYGDVKYTPGEPLNIKISYSGGQVEALLLKAETLFSSYPVGMWRVVGGEAVPRVCASPADSLVSTEMSKMGIIEAEWTSPLDLSGYVEFQLTVIGTNKFWLWNSMLVDSE